MNKFFFITSFKLKLTSVFFLLLTINSLNAQSFKVLIFHKTNGFRHAPAITKSIQMITELGNTNGWTVEDTQNSTAFTATNLARFKVVIWANTSGDNLLSATEKTAFQNFIKNGGGFIGIHAATDTYRDKSWPWYNDLVGAIVQTNPNHTSNNLSGTMDVLNSSNAIVNHLGATWTKNEEWYYWQLNGGYLYSGNINLLQVRSTGSNSYDAPRPTTWYKQYDGGRSFYTALGHNDFDYVASSNFGKMISKAILWASKTTTLDINDVDKTNYNKSFSMYPNPTKSETTIYDIPENSIVKVVNVLGKVVAQINETTSKNVLLDMNNLSSGVYIVQVSNDKFTRSQKLIYQK